MPPPSHSSTSTATGTHTHTYGYRYFLHSWAMPRTHKAEKHEWSPIPSLLLSDLQSPLDLQMCVWPLFSPHYSYDFMTMPETQHHKILPRKQVKSKSFPADAENSHMFDHTHTSKDKTGFLALCWTAEVLHILEMLGAITTVIPSVKWPVFSCCRSSRIPASAKGRRGRKRGTDLRNPILPLFSKREFSSNKDQGWSILLKTSEVGKQENCSRH